MADGKVGGAYFELSVNSAGFATEMNKAEATATKSAGMMASGFAATGAAIGATAVAAFAIGRAIREVYDTWVDRNNHVQRQLDDLSRAADNLAKKMLFEARGASDDPLVKRLTAIRQAAQRAVEELSEKYDKELNSNDRWYRLVMGDAPTAAEAEARFKGTVAAINAGANAAIKSETEKAEAKAEQGRKAKAEKERQEREKEAEETVRREARIASEIAQAKARVATDPKDKANLQYSADAADLADRWIAARNEEERKGINALIELRKQGRDEEIKRIEAGERAKMDREAARAKADADRERERQEKEEIASRKRINEADLKMQLDNLRRLEDARRAQTQGFGVGDASGATLADVVNTLRSIEGNTSMISR
jgi:hypothetical protein